MHASVRAFLDQLIDYAGLFPPAKLPLEDALSQYLRYRKESPHRWMLGRFVCMTDRMSDLIPLARVNPNGPLLTVAALGMGGYQADEVFGSVAIDTEDIGDFRKEWGNESVIDVLEFSLPKGAAIADVASQIPAVLSRIEGAKLRGFLEIPRTGTWQNDLDQFCGILESNGNRCAGLKLRCGGLSADAFPSDEQVAFFVNRVRAANLPWKATAGLHHPRRHWDQSLQVWHHGFLNVFAAGVLAWTNSLTEADIVAILSDREALHFRFEDKGMAWKDWSCTTEQIAAARSNFATSYGSCSFTEPCDDLTAMELI